MIHLLRKEAKLSTLLLTYLFLAFSLMTFIPGYPILCGTFFICLGMFQSYQHSREANDILYSVMLPVRKKDIVTAKYLFAVFLEMIAFFFMALFTIIRMTVLADAKVYVTNVLMAANPVYLAFVLVIFALFHCIFIGGFFKSAYYIGKPFVIFIVAAFFTIGAAEALHHIPGLEFLNAVNGEALLPQAMILAAGIILYIAITALSMKCSQQRFEQIDL